MQSVTIQMTLDASVDIAYLYLGAPGQTVARTVECDHPSLVGSVRLDIDADGHLLGIEVESARRLLQESLLAARFGSSQP